MQRASRTASPAQDISRPTIDHDIPSVAPRSPALSTASTADGEISSPELIALKTPKLPDHILGLLRRTPSPTAKDEQEQRELDSADTHNSWGSPYPPHLRQRSVSSEEDEDDPTDSFPIHRLDIQTPFLRPVSSGTDSGSGAENQPSSLAAVLVNRARRGPTRGITEDWIRQHTAGVDEEREPRHWLSDGTGDSENSSLSGSFSGDEAAWLHDGPDIRTPKARGTQQAREGRRSRKASRKYPRTRSSNETLKQNQLQNMDSIKKMASTEEDKTPDGGSDQSQVVSSGDVPVPETPLRKEHDIMSDATADAPLAGNSPPATPTRPAPTVTRTTNATPRIKKKVPWKGKSILVLLPRDEGRGQPGGRPLPLDETAVAKMMQSWEKSGYSTRGFDLEGSQEAGISSTDHSQSKGAWPDFDDMARERTERSYKVILPDLNGKLPCRRASCIGHLLTCLTA